MTITILYFAALRELVGASEEQLVLPPEVDSVGKLEAFLVALRPVLADRLRSVRWAHNERFCGAEQTLCDGDVMALLPPVAGG